MKSSGKRRPDSVKSGTLKAIKVADLNRGGDAATVIENAVCSGPSRWTCPHKEVGPTEGLYYPELQKVRLYDRDELSRIVLTTCTVACAVVLTVLGLGALVWLSILRVPTDPVLHYMRILMPGLISVLSVVYGYYFFRGRKRRRARRRSLTSLIDG